MAIAVDSTPIIFTYLGRLTDGGTVGAWVTASSTTTDLFDDDAQVGDCIYFGWNYGRFSDLTFNIGTQLVADGITLVWEYTTGSDTFSTLSVTDNTDSFKNAGVNTVTFTPPADWRDDSSETMGGTADRKSYSCWIRVRITAVTNISEGGAITTDAIKHLPHAILVTGDESGNTDIFKQIYDADQGGGWGFSSYGKQGIEFSCNIFMGDGGNATTVLSQNECVYLPYDNWTIFNLCTFTAGELDDDGYTQRGSRIEWRAVANPSSTHVLVADGADAHFYATKLVRATTYASRKYVYIKGATDFQDVVIENFYSFYPNKADVVNFKRVKIKDGPDNNARFFPLNDPGTVDDLIIQSDRSMCFTMGVSSTVSNVQVESGSAIPYRGYQCQAEIIDSEVSVDLAEWTWSMAADDWVKVSYTFNLRVIDNTGTAIESATVKMEDVNGTELFSVSTDASGDIAEQTIVYVQFDYLTSTTVTKNEKTPHTVTISKAGYPTRTIIYTMDRKREEIEKLSPDGTNIQDMTAYDFTCY